MAYSLRWPDLCDKRTGLPLYWRHYKYAMAWLGREQLREQLQEAQAFRLARTPGEEFPDWQRDTLRVIEP